MPGRDMTVRMSGRLIQAACKLPRWARDQVDAMAEAEDRTRSAMISILVREALAVRKAPPIRPS